MVEIDGVSLPMRYRKITQYTHQNEKSFSLTGMNPVAGWLLPGERCATWGSGRIYPRWKNHRNAPWRCATCASAPSILKIRTLGGGIRPRYAMVLPEITDCKAYSQARQLFLKHGVQKLQASGSAEAGFKLLSELHAAKLLPRLQSASCRVISFGIVPWSSQQKSRVQVLLVQPQSADGYRVFRLCSQLFVPRLVVLKAKAGAGSKAAAKGRGKSTSAKEAKTSTPFWSVPQVPDLVARNLAGRRPWWLGFAEFVADPDRGDHIFKYEREGLQKMVQNTDALPQSPERAFVAACHEAWRRQLGALGERSRNDGTSFTDKAQKEFAKVRVRFHAARRQPPSARP